MTPSAKILIIDKCDTFREATKQRFASVTSEIDCAKDETDAVFMCFSQKYDLVITRLKSQKSSARALPDTFQNHKFLQGLPIVTLSDDDSEASKRKWRRTDRYLKAVNNQRLKAHEDDVMAPVH